MHQTASEPFFLHVYDVESGLWASTTLGSPVSPHILEAMNHILLKDGILAYIGTRSEFGHYLSELKNETGKDYRHCWISLPASTIMSMLGLCLNTGMSGKPEMVFYGSPLTLALAYILQNQDIAIEDHIEPQLRGRGYFVMEPSMLVALGVYGDRIISASEYQEACSYMDDINVQSRKFMLRSNAS
jgi:hypothetical protein